MIERQRESAGDDRYDHGWSTYEQGPCSERRGGFTMETARQRAVDRNKDCRHYETARCENREAPRFTRLVDPLPGRRTFLITCDDWFRCGRRRSTEHLRDRIRRSDRDEKRNCGADRCPNVHGRDIHGRYFPLGTASDETG